MEFIEFTAKTVDEAIQEALIKLGIPSDSMEYEVVEAGSSGFLGFGSKPAKIKARKKFNLKDKAVEFLESILFNMNMVVDIKVEYDEVDMVMDIELKGKEMGILIGKRGQTLDSLQYLTSLVVNKERNKEKTNHIRVKLDIENYRNKRKETLENLAKNIASKVKRTRRSVTLEQMNPYERRIIHSILQSDKYVTTHSEGEEPYRRVVITLKK
jgi:Predicted RNA-binding protein